VNRAEPRGPLRQATYGEWLASLFGACLIAFALGVWAADLLGALAPPVLLVGVAVHAWGMAAVHRRSSGQG
jgi:hypothetical protein